MENIKKIYHEICLGYSKSTWKNSIIYIKHLSILDLVDLDSYYNEFLEEAKQNGIKNKEDKLEWLKNKNLWSVADEISLKKQQDFIDNLEKTNEKLVFKSQKVENEKLLKEGSEKLRILKQKKEELIGVTAEKIADRKIQYHYVYLSTFNDAEFKQKFFTLEEIYNLDEEDSNSILGLYVKNMEKFDKKNIKKITISNFFTDIFSICGDNINTFFGKPVYLLNNYQITLLSYGNYFKNVFMNNRDMPDNIRDDPEKIEEFIQRAVNFREMNSKIDSNAMSVGIVANNEDFESMGLKRDTSFLNSKGPSMEK